MQNIREITFTQKKCILTRQIALFCRFCFCEKVISRIFFALLVVFRAVHKLHHIYQIEIFVHISTYIAEDFIKRYKNFYRRPIIDNDRNENWKRIPRIVFLVIILTKKVFLFHEKKLVWCSDFTDWHWSIKFPKKVVGLFQRLKLTFFKSFFKKCGGDEGIMYNFYDSTDTLKFWTENRATYFKIKLFLFFIWFWLNLTCWRCSYPCVLQFHQVFIKIGWKTKKFY